MSFFFKSRYGSDSFVCFVPEKHEWRSKLDQRDYDNLFVEVI